MNYMIDLMQFRGFSALFDRGQYMKFRIIPLLILACLSLNAVAEDIALQKNHPERYTVVKGDTLWAVSYTHLDVYKRQALHCLFRLNRSQTRF